MLVDVPQGQSALEDYSKLYTYKEEENISKGWYIARAVISSDVHCTQSIVQKGKMGPVCQALNNKKHESKQYKK